jgi:hypothetical protein
MDQAQSEMDAISAALAEQYPASNAGKALTLTELQSFMVRNVRLSLLLLMGTTVLVLLIGVAHRLWQCGRPASGAGGAAPF